MVSGARISGRAPRSGTEAQAVKVAALAMSMASPPKRVAIIVDSFEVLCSTV
jgi:hypothetical protein